MWAFRLFTRVRCCPSSSQTRGARRAQRSGRPSITSLRYTHVRRVTKLDYDMTFVDLVEFDGIAPYSYSEELPYDDMLDQHTAGVQERTEDSPIVVVAALPRADSPSADRYVAERQGDGVDNGAR